MNEPNNAAKEIASYVFQNVRANNSWRELVTERDIAEAIQEMVDKGQIVGGIVATGDHEAEDGRTVLDWDILGRRTDETQV